MIIPPGQILARYEAQMQPLHEKRLHIRRSSATLTQLRDTLLPKLISGEIRVPEAEAQVEAAL